MRINHLLSNPDTFARKYLSEKDYEQFKVLFDYFKPLLEKRRKIRRRIEDKISKDQKEETEEKLQKVGPELERKTTLSHLKKIIEYFGSKGEYLTKEQREKIRELTEKIKAHLGKRAR